MLNTRKHDATVNSTTLAAPRCVTETRTGRYSKATAHKTVRFRRGKRHSYKAHLCQPQRRLQQSPDSQQVSYGISGGILAHENGITLS